jgi:hypothetical protein
MQVTCARNNLAKKMFGCPLKLILEFLGVFTFFVINQNIYTQLCMNVKTHHHQIYYFKLDYIIFFTSKFVSNKCYLQKVAQQKSWNPFSFFWNPIMHKPYGAIGWCMGV